uniref:Uncharacterized protein n=1 Tax=Plectus sambesii TaxID=2011161 RepID=A0A914W8S5_9BILA
MQMLLDIRHVWTTSVTLPLMIGVCDARNVTERASVLVRTNTWNYFVDIGKYYGLFGGALLSLLALAYCCPTCECCIGWKSLYRAGRRWLLRRPERRRKYPGGFSQKSTSSVERIVSWSLPTSGIDAESPAGVSFVPLTAVTDRRGDNQRNPIYFQYVTQFIDDEPS